MSTGAPAQASKPAACAACGGPLDAAGSYLDSSMRAVCGACHTKDLADLADISAMEDGLAEQRARQRKIILRVVGLGIGLLLLLLATLGR